MNLKQMIKIFILALCWGPSFFFIKMSVGQIPPLTFVAGRMTISAFILSFMLWLRGIHLPSLGKIWKHFSVVAFFSCALPFFLFTWAEMYVESVLASFINGLTPVFTALIAHFFSSSERLTWVRASGIFSGACGMLLMLLPAYFDGIKGNAESILAMIVGAVSYSIGMVYAKSRLTKLPFLVAPCGQMLVGSICLIPLAFYLDGPLSYGEISQEAYLSWLGISVLGTSLAFVVYYKILEEGGAVELSTAAYFFPLIGAFLGVVVLGEKISWDTYLAGSLILLGMIIVNSFSPKEEARAVVKADLDF